MPISYDSPFHPPEENEEGSISRTLLEVQGYFQPTTQHLHFIVRAPQDMFSPSYIDNPLSIFLRPMKSVQFSHWKLFTDIAIAQVAVTKYHGQTVSKHVGILFYSFESCEIQD